MAYDITGPQSLSASDLAAIYSDLAGQPVRTVAIGDDELIARLTGDAADGHLAYGARLVASFGRAIREGCFARVSDAVEVLTGRPPSPLREVLSGAGGRGRGAITVRRRPGPASPTRRRPAAARRAPRPARCPAGGSAA